MAGFWSNSIVWADLAVSPFGGGYLATDYATQYCSQLFLAPCVVKVFSFGGQFADLYSGQAAADDDNSVRVQLSGLSDVLSAPGRGSMGYATGVDHDKIGSFRRFDLFEAALFEKFSNLLAFVLVHFAAERNYGKCSHNVI
jgi:hypothetical protein